MAPHVHSHIQICSRCSFRTLNLELVSYPPASGHRAKHMDCIHVIVYYLIGLPKSFQLHQEKDVSIKLCGLLYSLNDCMENNSAVFPDHLVILP